MRSDVVSVMNAVSKTGIWVYVSTDFTVEAVEYLLERNDVSMVSASFKSSVKLMAEPVPGDAAVEKELCRGRDKSASLVVTSCPVTPVGDVGGLTWPVEESVLGEVATTMELS